MDPLRAMWLFLLLATAGVASAARAPAPAPGNAAVAEDQQPLDPKYRLAADPGSAGWTQGTTTAQSASSNAVLSAEVLSADTSSSKYLLPSQPTEGSWPSAPSTAGAATASPGSAAAESGAHPEAIFPASPNFVQTDGIHFTLDGEIKYFSGSNDYFLILLNYLTDSQIGQFFQTMAGNGIDLIRTWAFCNGVAHPCDGGNSFQPTLGVYNELAFQRLDLIMAEAAANNIHIIFPFVNYWPDLGGMQWYVDQVMGPGQDLENFFFNPNVTEAYKMYVTKILTRVNTITGVMYADDPIIFSLELANEPHTTDNYEILRGLPPGHIVKDWVYEMSAFVRSLSPNHMISTGEEGYRIAGKPTAWYNDGLKGIDFDGNTACPNISFATVHLYPGSWGIPSSDAAAFANQFLADRAAVAHAIGKPYILEETGTDSTYAGISYVDFLLDMFSAAEDTDAASIAPWELVPYHTTAGNFDFGIDDATFGAVAQMVEYQHQRTAACASGTCPAVTAPCLCFDIPPDSSYTCQQQVGFHPNCSDPSVQSFLGPGTCDISCGRCQKCPNFNYCADCTDVPPSGSTYTCPQQIGFHPNCSDPSVSSFLGPGTCDASCGRCSACPVEVVPPCQANIEVGPTWSVSDTEQSAKFQIYLTAPDGVNFTTPYTFAITGRAPFTSASPWNWEGTLTANGQVSGPVTSEWEELHSPSVGFTNLGGIFTGPAGQVFPQSVSVNGQTCGFVGSTYYGS